MKWNKLVNESTIPVIHSIDEFLELCLNEALAPRRGVVDKQGKIVNARRCENEGEKVHSKEGDEKAHEGDLIVKDNDGTEYVIPSFNVEKYYMVDANGDTVLDDQTKWQKIPMTLEYYITPLDVKVKVPWQDEPLMATKGYALVKNDNEGKDISPVAPDVFNDKTLWKNKR